MMLIPRRRLWVALAAVLLAAVVGGECGFQLGRAQLAKAAFEHLSLAARQSGGPFVSLVDESNALLDSLNASKQPPCSEAEIASFRQLLFQSEYLRDAGRMRDGRIECSTLFSRDQISAQPAQSAITLEDGLRIYRDVPPYRSSKWVVFLLQKGDSFVVEDLSQKRSWTPPDLDYESTMLDVSSGKRVRPGGKPLIYADAVIDYAMQGYVGDQQYVTLCWPRSTFCTSVFQSRQALLWANRGTLGWDILLGAGSGMALALLYLLFYHHSSNLSQQLRRAILKGELELVYQPIVDLNTGRIVEAEALARWTDEDGYAVSPEIFVRLAVERGMIGELTELVVERVLTDFEERLQRDRDFRININVTAADLADGKLLAMLDRRLRRHAVAARSLVIEVTEGSTARRAVAIETIQKLRERGHSVQIDDFGTGYSSLSYLKDLAIDGIKIDKAFTQAIGTDAVTSTLLPQMLSMAESLQLLVIVEGIETAEQAAYFAGKEQPILGQGWFFGRPAPAAKLLQLLEAQQESKMQASRSSAHR